MKRRMFAASLALAVVAVLGLARSAAAEEQVPFKGSLSGERVVFIPAVFAQLDCAGKATLLGKYELVVNANIGIGVPPVAMGTFEFVAANGDTLIAEFIGRRSPTEIPGVDAFEEIAVIVDGTGRFSGATGGFRVNRIGWLSETGTLLTVGDFDGTISLPSNP